MDDRGPDHSWAVLERLSELYPDTLKVIRFSRNFGQHVAIIAGLAECRGQAAIILDCDLQDPPEEIENLYRKYQEGFRIVTARRKLKEHSQFKKMTSRFYSKLLKSVFGVNMDSETGAFSLIDRSVVNEVLRFKDNNIHYLAILDWLGFDKSHIDYKHQPREWGRSGYTLKKLLAFALQGIFFQSTRFLLFIIISGLMISTLALAAAVWAFFVGLTGEPISGWASQMILTSLLGGFIIVIQGVVGLYVGQIFEQVKDWPRYIVSDRLNFDKPT